jgi:hypothetical protein
MVKVFFTAVVAANEPRWRWDPDELRVASTEDVQPIDALVGQGRGLPHQRANLARDTRRHIALRYATF